jgi:hypothetical protein
VDGRPARMAVEGAEHQGVPVEGAGSPAPEPAEPSGPGRAPPRPAGAGAPDSGG